MIGCVSDRHAAVEFQHLGRPVRRDHQAGVEKARVRMSVRRHAAQCRLDHFAHDARMQFRRHYRRGRVGTHAAGVRTLIVIVARLVVL